MVTNTAKMDTLIITMGTGAILRKDILITIMGMAEITTMVTGGPPSWAWRSHRERSRGSP